MSVSVVELNNTVVLDASCGCVSDVEAIHLWSRAFSPDDLVNIRLVAGSPEKSPLTCYIVDSPDMLGGFKVFVVRGWLDVSSN